MNLTRRKFFVGLSIAAAAPAIVRVASIMPVSAARYPNIYGDLNFSQIETMRLDAEFLEQMQQAQVHMLMYGTAGFKVYVGDDDVVRAQCIEPREFLAWT